MTSNLFDSSPLLTPLGGANAADPGNGLLKLVLALAQFLHELMERQSLRRIEDGTLSEAEIDRLGMALLEQAQQLEAIRVQHGLSKEDLNLDLGPVGNLF
jgi:hypothetical protein